MYRGKKGLYSELQARWKMIVYDLDWKMHKQDLVIQLAFDCHALLIESAM